MERYLTEFNTDKLKSIQIETVIIGSGLAGLSTALKLEELNVNYIIISKKDISISNSYLAQGGVAVSLDSEDNTEEHFKDTVKAGKGLCIKENTKILVDDGVKRVIDLINIKVPFDKKNGIPLLTKEGAHSKRRILHVKDETGKAILKTVYDKLPKERFLIGYTLEEILVDENRYSGIIISNDRTKEKLVVKSKSLVIATGGYSAIYERNTSAYKISGDTLGVAFRAGLKLKDLEFVQFHPTAIYVEGEKAKLITEAIRGEGALLLNNKGERFINELKPRDEVARAIFFEYKKGNKVYLDISPLFKKGINFEKRFPTVYKTLKELNLEKEKLIPVSPATHYTIGGIETNSFGETNINGIFAVGEVSCTGVHGANRLASNSLLECMVFGNRVAYGVYKHNLYSKMRNNLKIKNSFNTEKLLTEKEQEYYIKKIKKIMWDYVGLIRDENSLKYALKEMEEIYEKLKIYSNIRHLLDIITLSKCIILSAMNRKESRGGHYRIDYPNNDDTNYKKHTKVYNYNGVIKIEFANK